ncbi:MAG: hypothetical protein NZM12_00770, partial [Steroidobacteraceae bacterium]|nr:hypothetical protein [Steroidobacteraceae bacterium]MDW8258467.1 hypothetical protein [Gammaproteobacteria bacterium]
RGLLADLSRISAEAEIACLAATLNRLETDVAAMRARADAWAVGDVAALRGQPVVDQQLACWGALNSAPRIAELRERYETAWFEAAVAALERHSVTLAIAPIQWLLDDPGMLGRFRARGYEIIAP